MTARRRPRAVPHPGSACCDPAQDLAGWITRETARLDVADRWARVLSRRGQRLRRAGTSALSRGDRERAAQLDAEALSCSGRAMAIWQTSQMHRGHVERVAEAHAWRLSPAPTERLSA
ncbi:hypothetical protein [Micromonospora okii]|uniref:hypothetical protein n=1 Tax=Micromonospora okii TaxID=1182970 RepID=UPI001E331721|nr:hypothetical protein [Micromonospora okii]